MAKSIIFAEFLFCDFYLNLFNVKLDVIKKESGCYCIPTLFLF